MSGSALLLKLLSIFQEEFLCPRTDRCIPRTWLCDGDLDCAPDARPPSEDEAPDLCSRKKCGRGEFQCLSGQGGNSVDIKNFGCIYGTSSWTSSRIT